MFERDTGIPLAADGTWQYTGLLLRAAVNKMVPKASYGPLKVCLHVMTCLRMPCLTCFACVQATTPVFGAHFDAGPSVTVVLVLCDSDLQDVQVEGGGLIYSTRSDGLLHTVRRLPFVLLSYFNVRVNAAISSGGTHRADVPSFG